LVICCDHLRNTLDRFVVVHGCFPFLGGIVASVSVYLGKDEGQAQVITQTVRMMVAAVILLSSDSQNRTIPFEQTESREPCAAYVEQRQPLFGELHIHTGYSQDAMLVGVRTTPADAYRFARGEEVSLSGPLSNPEKVRPHRLRRPLDFAAVTDHAEYLGPVSICLDPTASGYDTKACRTARGEWNPWWIPTMIFKRLAVLRSDDWTSYLRAVPKRSPICDQREQECERAAVDTWQVMQQSAEDAYDRSERCAFTTFMAYEFTAAPDNLNLHRNVIFRNAEVPERAYSAIDAGNDPKRLWDHLQRECLDAGNGCDVLAIPHNSNLSLGAMFADPADANEARLRRDLEPLVEIYQHKGNSECYFDASGMGTNDELCGFERIAMSSLKIGLFGGEEVPPRAYVREALKRGLGLHRELGVNPFEYGLIAGTDNHNGTPGDTRERDWEGAFGGIDADLKAFPINRMTGAYATFSPGGLAVVWAEENSRDSIFAALRRRETYATSGTRPVVRFFGGFGFESDMCGSKDFVAKGYALGVPMGGRLAPPSHGSAPRFAVWAVKDLGSDDEEGADLQRIQIIKGWLDADGRTHEAVYDVVGNRLNGAQVDPVTLDPLGTGAVELCTVWEDPDFDPAEPAFYYARVLENPTARWSALQCRQTGVDIFADAATCKKQVRENQGYLAEYLTACCPDEQGNYSVEHVIQERAWTSPIWYDGEVP